MIGIEHYLVVSSHPVCHGSARHFPEPEKCDHHPDGD